MANNYKEYSDSDEHVQLKNGHSNYLQEIRNLLYILYLHNMIFGKHDFFSLQKNHVEVQVHASKILTQKFSLISTAEQSERKAIRKRQLEVDQVELKWKIQQAVEEFNAKLLNLYKMRVAIEKCILAEELKILLYDRRMSVQDQLDREEEKLV